LLIGAAHSAVRSEFATLLLIHGSLALGAREDEDAYRVEGTSELSDGTPVPFAMTVSKPQGCLVTIETKYGGSDAEAKPTNFRVVDWTKARVDEISVSSTPVPDQGYEAYYRTISIPAHSGFHCVRDGNGPTQCTNTLEVNGAYVPGQRSIHDAQHQALTALMQLCHGKMPNLEPKAAMP
jgi:hypothetical protein